MAANVLPNWDSSLIFYHIAYNEYSLSETRNTLDCDQSKVCSSCTTFSSIYLKLLSRSFLFTP